jgi:hypothetical protein
MSDELKSPLGYPTKCIPPDLPRMVPMPPVCLSIFDLHAWVPDSADEAVGWVLVLGLLLGLYLGFRKERAETREREKLAEMRMRHAEETGDFSVLEQADRPRRSLLEFFRGPSDPPTPSSPARPI